jgi:Uma2 family endonuclease
LLINFLELALVVAADVPLVATGVDQLAFMSFAFDRFFLARFFLGHFLLLAWSAVREVEQLTCHRLGASDGHVLATIDRQRFATQNDSMSAAASQPNASATPASQFSLSSGSSTSLVDGTAPPYPIRRFTVREYDAMAQAGILQEDSNVELLEGWIVPKTTKRPPHDGTIDLVAYLVSRLLGAGWFIRSQNALVTSDSEPEPDLAVVRGSPGDYRDRHPIGADVGLIIEVADATVRQDRRKAKIYAAAGIPHYWIVNLDQRQLEIYAQPVSDTDSDYRSHEIRRANDEAVSIVLDGATVGSLTVGAIFG